MKLYRFELAFMGEMQNVGFLHGLNDIGLDAETERQMLAPFALKMKALRPWGRNAFVHNDCRKYTVFRLPLSRALGLPSRTL